MRERLIIERNHVFIINNSTGGIVFGWVILQGFVISQYHYTLLLIMVGSLILL